MREILVRYRFVLLAAVGVALVAGAVASERAGRSGAVPGEVVVGQLGPTPGPDAEGYVAEKRAYLAQAAAEAADAPAAALVSFSRLLAATEAAALLQGMGVDVVFVRFPGADPEVIGSSGSLSTAVGARIAEVRAVWEAEVAGLEEKASAAGGEERERLLGQAAERKARLSLLGLECACLYAVAVSGTTLGSLAALQERDETRLVDITRPPVADLRGWELTPLLPADPP